MTVSGSRMDRGYQSRAGVSFAAGPYRVPHALVEDGQLIKLYDAAYHEAAETEDEGLLRSSESDPRWIRIRRPTVMVGGELTLDNTFFHDNEFSILAGRLPNASITIFQFGASTRRVPQ